MDGPRSNARFRGIAAEWLRSLPTPDGKRFVTFFVNSAGRHRLGPDDLLFVPAGVEHRFDEFTDDLTVWVAFYGPEGGEAAEPGRH